MTMSGRGAVEEQGLDPRGEHGIHTHVSFCVDRKTRIRWWEPYGETVKTSLSEVRTTGVLRAGFWIRVFLIATGTVGLLIAAMMLAYPGMWLPWPQISSGLVISPVAIALLMGLTLLAPQHVEVRHDWIQFTHGQSAFRIRAAHIRDIAVTQEENGVLRLRVTYEARHGLRRTRACVVAPAVNREALEALVAHLAQEGMRHAAPPVASPL
jgi:hypothetical protein